MNVGQLLEVFPNGSEDKNRGHISIFFYNDSGRTVICSYEMNVGSQTHSSDDKVFTHNDGRGHGKVFDHFFCRSWKQEAVDEILEIFCKISKIWTGPDFDPVFKSTHKLDNEKQEKKMSSLTSMVLF